MTTSLILHQSLHSIASMTRRVSFCFYLSCLFLGQAMAQQSSLELHQYWDESIPLANPHKGWYHHYFDNCTWDYLPKRDHDLLGVAGMDHIYLRLAWSYLEPKEGEYNWELIDREIEKWTELGLKVAFRITARETGKQPIEQQFATPKWVIDAGAKGGHYLRDHPTGDPSLPWEPDYADPVFLEKLENFLRAFAARYDGKPWLRYVDIGSIGDWGEGHLFYGSMSEIGYETRLKHIKLHQKYFKKTLLVVVDDYWYAVGDKQSREKLHQYIVDSGLSYRDDSVLVDYYAETYPQTFSVAHPEVFEDVYRKVPTVLELQHLRGYAPDGKWEGKPGTPLAKHNATGSEFVRGAIKAMKATYIGYHGPADQWMKLPGNPQLSDELLNLCGYWYFPHRVTAKVHSEQGMSIDIEWENRGVAPAYHPYRLAIRLADGDGNVTTDRIGAGNMRWMPSTEQPTYVESYTSPRWKSLSTGEYELAIRMDCPIEELVVLLPLKSELQGDDGFYCLGKITIPSDSK